MPIDLSLTFDAGEEHEAYLARHLSAAAERVAAAPAVVSVAVVGDGRMAELHERFLGITGPTDVLTFELEHDEAGRVTEGEVVVNLDEARRRAGEEGHPAERELLLYALHGLLHLSGHDDTTPEGFEAMHAEEDRILRALGVGATFAPEP